MIVIFGIRVVGKGSWKDGEFISKFLCLVEDREVRKFVSTENFPTSPSFELPFPTKCNPDFWLIILNNPYLYNKSALNALAVPKNE